MQTITSRADRILESVGATNIDGALRTRIIASMNELLADLVREAEKAGKDPVAGACEMCTYRITQSMRKWSQVIAEPGFTRTKERK